MSDDWIMAIAWRAAVKEAMTDDVARSRQTDPLITLRGEVERLRDKASALLAVISTRPELRYSVHARRQAFKEVLDLIDKHAREGQ